MNKVNQGNEHFVPSSHFPAWFRQGFANQIINVIAKNESGQIIGLPGIGLSSFIDQFSSQQSNPELQILTFDLNVIGPTDIEKIKKQIGQKLTNSVKTVVFFESANRLYDDRFTDLTTAILGWRKAAMNKLSFFFSFNYPISNFLNTTALKPIWSLLGENQMFIPLLDKKESEWFALTCAKQYQLSLSNDEINIVYHLTGGFMQTIKRLVRCISKNISLSTIQNNPTLDIHLNHHFELIVESLNLEKKSLTDLAYDNPPKLSTTQQSLLHELSVLNNQNQLTPPLFAAYLKNTNLPHTSIHVDLTASEYQLFKVLKSNLNQICSRDTSIKAVWGEKGWEVNEHALDQLIHRLKRKLTKMGGQYNLLTLRGRGLKLTYNN